MPYLPLWRRRCRDGANRPLVRPIQELYQRLAAAWQRAAGTYSHVASRCDALDGQRQHASCLHSRHPGGKPLGGYAPLCRLLGLWSEPRRCHTDRPRLSSVQPAWQPSVQAGRLCLPHTNRSYCRCRSRREAFEALIHASWRLLPSAR